MRTAAARTLRSAIAILAIVVVAFGVMAGFGAVSASAARLGGVSTSDLFAADAVASSSGATLGASAAPVSGPATALEPIDLDSRFTFWTPSTADGQTCYTFTLTNNTSQLLQWTIDFDTSKAPLNGLDPRTSGAFATTWGFTTRSFDPVTHLWVISGSGLSTYVLPGWVVTGGYCLR